MADPTRFLPLAFLGFGALFLVLGLSFLVGLRRFRRRAVRCRGVVVGHNDRWSSSSDGGGSILHYPILEFRTADGRAVRTEARVGTSWHRYRPGQDVLVTYDPRNPEHAYPGKGGFPLLLGVVFVGFGVLFGGIGLIVLLATGA